MMPEQLPALNHECFVISPIGSEGSPERQRSDDVFEFIIAEAAKELGLTAVRGDQVDEPGQITRQVIDHVLGARAAVADLTYLNPNVFYELAVRHTARLPVALIAARGCDLPFDIAQMRTIFFELTEPRSVRDCKRQVVQHLDKALAGAVDSPIVTSIDARNLAEGSSADRSIADILTAVDNVARSQRSMADELGQLRHEMRTVSVGPQAVALIRAARDAAAGLATAAGKSISVDPDFRDDIQQIMDALDAIPIDVPQHGRATVSRFSKRPTLRSREGTTDESSEE